jgi:hypothetical protein
MKFNVRDFKLERLWPSLAIYNGSIYFRSAFVNQQRRLLKLSNGRSNALIVA